MNRLVQEAVLVGLARRLRDQGSWTGETHLQKATYLLSELYGIDFDFDFILYKHGPFSFDLRDELAAMGAEGLIDSTSVNPRYGPRLEVTTRGEQVEQSFSKTMARYGTALDWMAKTLGNRGVMDLERLATAMWVTRKLDDEAPVSERAAALRAAKPHISEDDAEAAVKEIDELLAQSATAAS